MGFVAPMIMYVDMGHPLVLLGESMSAASSCSRAERVRAIRDLKGKTGGGARARVPQYVFLASMLAYVGLDPGKDVNWVDTSPS